MELQDLQTGLCRLIKSRTDGPPLQDEYLRRIAGSSHLALVRQIALWWRKIQVESYCVLTAPLLRQDGGLDSALGGFFRSVPYAPFRDEVGRQFLDFVSRHHAEELVRIVAAFELALSRARTGGPPVYISEWPCEPYALIAGLLGRADPEQCIHPGRYLVEINVAFGDELFRVTCLDGTS